MTVGTRLSMMLLLAITPVVGVYTYWNVQRSTGAYVHDLKREIRAATLGLAPALENDLRTREWGQIDDVIRRMTGDGTTVALLDWDGRVLRKSADFRQELISGIGANTLSGQDGAAEFHSTVAARHWFCRLVPLRAGDNGISYLLVAQDWTNISQELRGRAIWSALVAMSVVAAIAVIISVLVRRYVSNPLAELSQKVMRFSNEEDLDRSRGGDEVRLLSEEFRRLDEQLTMARADLTEKHRRELELERRLQRTERLATIGTLASGLAHEIGTPMGVIRGRAEFLLQSKPTLSKTQEGLTVIVGQIDRISRIVRMLLDYARSRRESLRVIRDVRPIVQRALSLVETELVRRNIELKAELGSTPLTVECDPDQLEQVFVNLVMNALDAMTPAGGTVRVSTEREENGGARCVRIAFEDTGLGIMPEHRAHVFDPFFTTKEPGKGTGMGLAVSQSIMRDHNGEIALDATTVGTRFCVTIPIIDPEPLALRNIPTRSRSLQ
ncbi:MAG TPA: ATP-binding protein [Candidatus Binataceae bacterium]|nr:ATP-binding protein [Candidatus Binataceae bacterium]